MPFPKESKVSFYFPFLIFFFTFAVFVCNVRYIPSGDTLPSELLPISLIGEGDFDFNEFVSDPSKLEYYYRNINGTVVSSYPVIPGLFNLPVYLAAHLLDVDLQTNIFHLSLMSSALIASFSVVFLYFCLLHVCRKRVTALLFSLVYAFATSLWSVVCRSMWQHGPSLFLLNLALLFLINGCSRTIPFAGLFLGFAVFNRPVNILLVLPLVIYVFVRDRKEFLRFILLALIPAVLLFTYSKVYWGDVTSLGQVQGASGFNGNLFEGLCGLLFSPSRGLFIYSPILLFSMIQAFRVFFQKGSKPLYRYMSSGVFLSLLVTSGWGMWWGGWTFGYRLLSELLPFLIIFLALYWEEVLSQKRLLKGIFLALLAVSLYVHFLGAFCYPAGFNEKPNNIDKNPRRLWNVKDNQIFRCQEKLLKRIGNILKKTR